MEVFLTQSDASDRVLIELSQEGVQRPAQNGRQPAAPFDHTLVAAPKAFDEGEVRLGGAHDVA